MSEVCCGSRPVCAYKVCTVSFVLLFEIPTGVDCGENLGKTQVEFTRTILLYWMMALGMQFTATSCLKYSMVNLLICSMHDEHRFV